MNCLIQKNKNFDTDYLPNYVVQHILSFLVNCTNCIKYDIHDHIKCISCDRQWCTNCIKLYSHIQIKYCYYFKGKICNYCNHVVFRQTPMMIVL